VPIPDRGPPGWANRPRSVDTALPRRVCPDSVSPPGAPFETFLPHALFFRGDKIKERIAGDVDEVMRREQLFDLLARPARKNRSRFPIEAYSALLRAVSSSSGEALISAWLSTTMSRPPGRNTRSHSSIARSGFGNARQQ